ncbi:MAG: FAD-dependent oxidoreductase, partial [Aridibacter sp.]
RTIDWDCFEKQEPDETPVPFSFSTHKIEQQQINCYIGYTNTDLHNKIKANLNQSPLYSGAIKGVGPRYCPSIEDKVVKFADKTRHQLFLEPEGYDTNEVYLNGFSTSLPANLQQDLLRMIRGFEEVRIIRPGYAIEYDFVDPRELKPSMETTRIKGLFFAGQINGTTGYEEAACQGLMAGINAMFHVKHRNPIILERNEGYIGVLVDDLIKNGVDEPYRIFTSRAESRLTLRHDNADERLSPKGKEIGLVDDIDWEKFNNKRNKIAMLRNTIDNLRFKRSDVEYSTLSQLLNMDLGDSITLSQIYQRQGIDENMIYNLLPNNVKAQIKMTELNTALADSLYSGYAKKQDLANKRVNRNDGLKVPQNFNFNKINGLSREMMERIDRVKPKTFGQIRKISGLTPAALSTVLVHLTASKN